LDPLPPETESAGGIVLPSWGPTEAGVTNQGIVLAVSKKYADEYEWPEVGDKVWFRHQWGQMVTLNGKDLYLVDIQDVFGVVT
jgi:co-chaperonin GroES (HSP10)